MLRGMSGAPTRGVVVALMLLGAGCGVRSTLDITEGAIPSALDFGEVECGSTDVTKVIPVEAGDVAFDWAAQATGPFAVVGDASGHLEPGERASLVVVGNAIQTAHAGEVVYGSLHLRTGTLERDIPLRAVTRGSELEIPAVLDFGGSNTNLVRSVVVRNVGVRNVAVRLGEPSTAEYRLVVPLGSDGFAHLVPGASATAQYEFNPLSSGSIVAKAPITVEGGACGRPPTSLELRGTGGVGAVKVSAAALDFGTVDCGTISPTRSFSVTNTSDAPFQFEVHPGGTYPNIDPAAGTLAPHQTVEIKVTLPENWTIPFPTSRVVVKTDAPNDTLHFVDFVVDPRGAVLKFGPKLDVGKLQAEVSVVRPIAVTNSGNASVTLVQTNVQGNPPISTVAVGTSQIPVTLRPSGPLGSTLSSKAGWVVSGGSVCMRTDIQPLESTVSYELYERASALSVAGGTTICTAAPSGFYCAGNTAIYGIGLPVGFNFETTRLGVTSGFTPFRILAGGDGLCANEWCYFAEGTNTPKVQGFMDYSSISSTFVACGQSGCIGRNYFGAWGNPNIGSSLLLTPTPAFSGSGNDPIAIAGPVGYAVHNGQIYAAGRKFGYNLGPTSVPDGTVVTPFVVLDGITDARTVSAYSYGREGACMTHLGGTVTCWDTDHAPSDKAGVTDALSVRAMVPDLFCYQHISNSTIDCSDQGVISPVTGIVYPIKAWSNDLNSIWVVENDGRVTRIRPLPMVRMKGFDPP